MLKSFQQINAFNLKLFMLMCACKGQERIQKCFKQGRGSNMIKSQLISYTFNKTPKTPPKYVTDKKEINMKRFVSNRCLTKMWQDFVSSSVFNNTMRLSKNILQHKTTWKSIKESQKCIQKFLKQQKGRISVSQPLWEIWRATLISYIDA